jgi:penicillin-binding protein 1C
VIARFAINHWRLTAVFAAIMSMATADIIFAPPLDRASAISPLVTDRNGEWLHAFTNDEGRWRFGADLDAIDPAFVERLVLIEDKRFRSHWGVDPLALMRASFASAKAGRVVSGASTITMQTARLLEPRPRTIGSKAIEMIRALQIERRLSKDEILELYLTLAPYGGNIEGLRAASLVYFDKEPGRLTDAEQALLIALPQAPEARRPDLKSNNARIARAEILEKLIPAGAITAKQAMEAEETPVAVRRREFVRLAYHATQRLAKTRDASVIQSTIDAGLQTRAEAIVTAYAKRFEDGATASLLIIENETRAVRAAVGSSGLDVDGGWIDLTAATRSPGSTLKPFIYALAFEDGLAGPATIIEDMPRSFGGYTPENFDRTFRGEVRVREALQHSLNLPAVRALDGVGAARFSALMRAAGIQLKTPQGAETKSGLALALGGAGITAQDMAMLYAALGEGGKVNSLAWTRVQEDELRDAYQLFSGETAERISAILSEAPALSGRAPAALSVDAPRIAFKTGTSYGYRDAWSAGHGGGYSVVAWVGRADGAPRPGETGRKAAAPLLFDVFDMLAREGKTRDGIGAPEEGAYSGALVARFDAPVRTTPPEIIFPRDGVEVFLGRKNRGYALAARGGGAQYRWYVDGEPLRRETLSGRVIWNPARAGFYDVTVVDRDGRSARSKVRVIAG